MMTFFYRIKLDLFGETNSEIRVKNSFWATHYKFGLTWMQLRHYRFSNTAEKLYFLMSWVSLQIVPQNSKPKDKNAYLPAKCPNCALLMSANFYSARKRKARLEISMWNWKLSGWPRLSGLERAAVPLWHINLYGELTVQHRSQAPSTHRAPSLSPWVFRCFVRFVFLHTFMKLWPRKVSHWDPASTNIVTGWISPV